MEVVLTGSIAFDYLMHFPGEFREHILPEKLDALSLSFLVDSMDKRRGGIAANIAYTLALLGESPQIMASVGDDFADYRSYLESIGVRTAATRTIEGEFTASFFVTTDDRGSQIASFYTGAMAEAGSLRIADLDPAPDLVMVSPNDPGAMIAYTRECHELGIPYIYDPSQQLLRLDPQELVDGIERSEALFANEYELALIGEKTGLTITDISTQTAFTVITRAEQGSDLYVDGERSRIPAIVPVPEEEPTGVGDAYRGGFLKGYMNGLPLECCAKIGALCATYSLQQLGPQGHDFNYSEFVERFEKEFGDDCGLVALAPTNP